MAADIKPPRIHRDITNMECAANAARLRAQRVTADAGQASSDMFEEVLGEMRIARTFMDAADNFLDGILDLARESQAVASRTLGKSAEHAQTLLMEASDKLSGVYAQLDVALGIALDPAVKPSSLAIAMEQYRKAFLAQQEYQNQNMSGDAAVSDNTQKAFDDLVCRTFDEATAVLLLPASSVADMVDKQAVIDLQEAYNWDGHRVASFTRQLIADAIALAGGEV